MSSNGITAKEARDIANSSEKPDFVKRKLNLINDLIETKSKDNGFSTSVSILKKDMSLDDLELIIQDLKERGFKAKISNSPDWNVSYYIDIEWL